MLWLSLRTVASIQLWPSTTYECDDSKESSEMVQAAGFRSNFIGGQFLQPSFKSLAKSLHRQIVSYSRIYHPEPPPAAVLARCRKRFAYYTGIPKKSAGGFWAIACKSGELWLLIDRVLEGNHPDPSGDEPKLIKSTHRFNQMGGIGDRMLIKLLEKVVEGKRTMKDFNNDCVAYKLEIASRKAIMSHLDEAHPRLLHEWAEGQDDHPDDNLWSWPSVCKAFPVIGNEMYDTWREVLKQNFKLGVVRLPSSLATKITNIARDVHEAVLTHNVIFFFPIIIL
jgi:hypothetical protein